MEGLDPPSLRHWDIPEATDCGEFPPLFANQLPTNSVRCTSPEPFISGVTMIRFVTFNLQCSFRTSEDRAALIAALLRRA